MMRSRFLCLLLLVLLIGCANSNDQSAEVFIATVKQGKSNKIASVPATNEYKSEDYMTSALRDPFEPSPEFLASSESHKKANNNNTNAAQQPRPDADRHRELLENYSLDSMRMVGVIKKGTTFWAIIKDKTGLVHRVHVGNYLGENSGCITNITERGIEVNETVADGQNGWVQRMAALTLAK